MPRVRDAPPGDPVTSRWTHHTLAVPTSPCGTRRDVNTMGYDCCSSTNWNCGPGARRYLSKAERLQMLQDYQKDLEGELQGVKERISEIQR